MKKAFSLVTLSLLSVSPALASSAEAGRYFAADGGVTIGALVLAAGVMAAVRISKAGRCFEEARILAPSHTAWRAGVLHNLEADLQDYSRQLRRAA